MNIFVNFSHPAHVHFFKNAVKILSQRGHKIIAVARNKEFTIELLKAYNIDHAVLTNKGKGVVGLIRELLEQQLKIAKILKRHPIDLMLQIGGIFNAPVGKFFTIPTLAFSDTENDRLGNKIAFTLSKHVFSPTCFDHQMGGSWRNQIHYPGYHELAYLSPQYESKIDNPDKNFLVRFVGWGAGHDLGEKWLSDKQKIELVRELKRFGPVWISSEMPLPVEISDLACRIHPAEIHYFMSSCKLIVGESATMTSEAACLGIPAIFISNTGRGYTTEQDRKYGLIKHYRLDQWDRILQCLRDWAARDLGDEWQKRRRQMLNDKIEVTDWLVALIENYPASISDAACNSFERYAIQCAA
jgi:predicted glycosyltransferase